jgi:hypothetical protein
MNGEQRASIRKRIPLDVVINYAFLDSRRWCTRDIGLDSAFVKMRQPSLPLGAAVDAMLVLEHANGIEHHHVPAQIIRVTKEGVALKFGDYGQHTYNALLQLLDAPPEYRLAEQA